MTRDHNFDLTRSLLGRGVGTGVYAVPGKLAKLKGHKEGNSRMYLVLCRNARDLRQCFHAVGNSELSHGRGAAIFSEFLT